MKIFLDRMVKQHVATICDRCNKRAEPWTESDEWGPEHDDFLSYSDTGGYDSVHGDGTSWSIDLCGPCTLEVLGPWIKRSET